MLSVTDSVSLIPELNKAQKTALKKLEVGTIWDLLNILPRRYDDYTNCTPVGSAPINQPVTLKGTIEEIKQAPGFRRRVVMIRAKVKDDTGSLNVIWFNQPWLLQKLKPGMEIFLSGTISLRPTFGRQLSNPIWEPADDVKIAGSVAPVYPLTGAVAQKTMRELVASVIEQIEAIADPLTDRIRTDAELPTLLEAYQAIHHPSSLIHAERGRKRLAFDEFLTYRLALGSSRNDANSAGAPKVPFDESFAKKFVASLPFELTDDQKRATWASFQDLDQTIPMRRLLQGDVGSGKTIVAAFAMAMVYRSGQTAVLMAPTEILAKQHALSIRRFVTTADQVPVLLLTSSDKRLWEGGKEHKVKLQEARDRAQQGRLVVIGTHALLYRDMLPPDTALAIVDEQHRFGVAQREALSVARRPDGLVPHLLSMTATPIPRSLALTLYGDLDLSLIRTKPKGRLPIRTKVLVGTMREQAYDAIRSEVAKGHRAFIVCPLIDESDKLGVKSASEEAKRLASGPLKGLTIGLLHGKLSPPDKDGVMQSFVEGLVDILVSTTVVEVGVDVPEATVMAIEGAERFGLAQLHQLRGRVGRSDHPSSCYLMSDAEGLALDRLKVMEQTNDGFVIAEEDLKRRGEGNLLGMQQSGQVIFKAARATDLDVMVKAKDSAEKLLEDDPDLTLHQGLRKVVEKLKQTSHQE
ncbi:ATP-dependent DNA helicase RecG [Candidatus Uhrbacteria bacterium]|nr:ATP-dependent DNA helicase RecG [Candidatus Uhrbacteria bacterium]MBD3284482.1 ATP-dependent DNA helicase RecG [Candidatus Uhrbacteria bacterium]